MTAPRGSGQGDAVPTPRALVLLPYLLVLAAAALTPPAELFSNQGDVGLYLEKARALAAGLLPYRDFPFEYPPLALVPMAVPYFAWPFGGISIEVYKWLFAGWQAVSMLALGLALMRIVRLGGDAGAPAGGRAGEGRADEPDVLARRLRRVALQLFVLSIGAALALTWRFDLFPALLATVAIWAALDNRPGLAGVAVTLGILAKLYPLAIVPALAIPWLVPLDVRRLSRYAVAAAAITAAVLGPFVVLAGGETFAFLRYQADRGLQIESVGGGLAVLLGLVTGNPPSESYGFSSVQVEGPFASAWLAALPIAIIAGFGLLGWLGWRRIRRETAADGRPSSRTVVLVATAAVLLLLATSKVFSIQYVVWLVPVAALLGGRRFWLAAALVALTMPIHPMLYSDLVDQEALPIVILNLRNALLVVLLAWVIRDVARDREGEVARPAGLEPTTFRSAT